MHILVTNDDGIQAPGLLALANAMRPLGKVTVFAPDRNWSVSGHAKTMHRPLRVRSGKLADNTPALVSDGAPSDCVALALLGILPEKVDLVVSGINPHANLGHDVTYSGTVTSAMEAVINGVPGIAFSLDNKSGDYDTVDFSSAGQIASQFVRIFLANQLPAEHLVSVNIPSLPLDQIKGWQITRQGRRIYRDRLDVRHDPRGRPYYWIGGDIPEGVLENGTDVGALAQGFVSITPFQLDMTAYRLFDDLSKWEFPKLGA